MSQHLQTTPAHSAHGRIWTFPFFLTTLVSFLVSNVNQMTIPLMPGYVASIGGSTSMLGTVLAVFPLAAMAARPVSGMLTDRFGRRIVMMGGAVLYFLGTLPLAFSGSVWMLLAMRVLQGAGFSALSTAAGTLAADLVPHDRISEGIGQYSLSMTLGMAAGPVFGQLLVRQSGYPLLFTSAAILMAVTVPLSLVIRQRPVEPSGHRMRFPSDFIEKPALPAAAVMLSLAVTFASVGSFITALGTERAIGNAGLFYTIYAFAILAIRLFGSKIPSKIGAARTMLASLVPMVAGLALIGGARQLGALLTAAVLYGMGYGLVFPLLNAEALARSPISRRGSASATFSLSIDIGIALGSILWSQMLSVAHYDTVFYGSIVFALLAGALFFLFRKQLTATSSSTSQP